MILVHEKITSDKLMELRRDCFDYSSKHNDAMLRGRHIFMFRDKPGFTCVEENTNGTFIVGYEATLNQALHHLQSC